MEKNISGKFSWVLASCRRNRQRYRQGCYLLAGDAHREQAGASQHPGRDPASSGQSCWAAEASGCWVKTVGGYLLSELGCSHGSCGSSCTLAAASGSDPRVPPQLGHITRGGGVDLGEDRQEITLGSASETEPPETVCNQRQCSLHLGCMFLTSSSGLPVGDAFYVHLYCYMFPWDRCLCFWFHHNPDPARVSKSPLIRPLRKQGPQGFLKTETTQKKTRKASSSTGVTPEHSQMMSENITFQLHGN